MRLLDLFAGRLGWSRAFLARGWEVVAIDLVLPPEIPDGVTFIQADILELEWHPDCGFHIPGIPYSELEGHRFDAVACSSPCEQFSLHGMKMFHKNPPYPETGIKLFNHARGLCESSGILYIMENVRRAQDFVGKASICCGPFALWGSGVPVLIPQGIKKGMRLATGYAGKKFAAMTLEEKKAARKGDPMLWSSSKSKARKEATAKAATIPPELANCVADYFERILEQRRSA